MLPVADRCNFGISGIFGHTVTRDRSALLQPRLLSSASSLLFFNHLISQGFVLYHHHHIFTMSKLSVGLKALINSPAARPHTVPAPKNITAIYQDIQQSAKANNVSQPSWLALSVRIPLPLTNCNRIPYPMPSPMLIFTRQQQQ
jgi:hypothetical protein